MLRPAEPHRRVHHRDAFGYFPLTRGRIECRAHEAYGRERVDLRAVDTSGVVLGGAVGDIGQNIVSGGIEPPPTYPFVGSNDVHVLHTPTVRPLAFGRCRDSHRS